MVPFDDDGNQMYYKFYRRGNEGCRQNFEFNDTLSFNSIERGRSAAHFIFKRKSTGKTVTVFLKDFVDFLPHLVCGSVSGTFTFCKRGENFGCRIITPE